MAADLTHAELESIRAECMADDVDVDLARMSGWTESEVYSFFESGGSIAPDQPSAAAIRSGGYADGSLAKLLRARLPPLNTAQPSMPGEDQGVKRRCFVPRPEARVPLFLVYGIADVAMSLEPWIRAAAGLGWLEIRLVDLPGHGFRASEDLPACSRGGEAALDESAIAAQRAQLIATLTDEIATAAGGAPYALYGFSFGALLAYGVALGMAERGMPPPLCLCVAGRGAPHCAMLSRATIAHLAMSDDEAMLAWQGGTQTIPAAMRVRAAQLFRCGILLGAAPAARGELSAPLPESGGVGALGGDAAARAVHIEGVPRVRGCPIVAVGSDVDAVWPDALVVRWAEVAEAADGASGDGEVDQPFVHLRLAGVEHLKVMNHAETMALCFREIGVAAAARAGG